MPPATKAVVLSSSGVCCCPFSSPVVMWCIQSKKAESWHVSRMVNA